MNLEKVYILDKSNGTFYNFLISFYYEKAFRDPGSEFVVF